MTMVVPEAAEAVEGAGSSVSGAGSKLGNKFGLTGSQKAGAIGAGIPQPRTHHPFLLGLLLIVGGGFMLVGSVTGTLPSMIAALFDPSLLDDVSGSPPSQLVKAIGTPNGTGIAGSGVFGAGSLYGDTIGKIPGFKIG